MGGKKRGDKRQQKRSKALASDLLKASASSQLSNRANQDLFFVDTAKQEGTTRSERLAWRKKRNQEALERKEKRLKAVSKVEERLVVNAVKKHGRDADKLSKVAQEGLQRIHGHHRTDKDGVGFASEATYDLWDDHATKDTEQTKLVIVRKQGGQCPAGIIPVDVVSIQPKPHHLEKHLGKEVSQKLPKNFALPNDLKSQPEKQFNNERKAIAVEVPRAGQSYRPDVHLHQDTIAEALAIEVRRNHAEHQLEQPIRPMSEATKALLLDSDDDDDDDNSTSSFNDDANKDKDETTTTTFLPRKKPSKRTKSQRNKQTRHKLRLAKHARLKKEKKFLHTIEHMIPHITSALDKKEKLDRAKREARARVRKEKQKEPRGLDLYHTNARKKPLEALSLPVALTEELARVDQPLQSNIDNNSNNNNRADANTDNNAEGAKAGGALHAMKPKGSLLTEHYHSMMARNMTFKKRKPIGKKKKRKIRYGTSSLQEERPPMFFKNGL